MCVCVCYFEGCFVGFVAVYSFCVVISPHGVENFENVFVCVFLRTCLCTHFARGVQPVLPVTKLTCRPPNGWESQTRILRLKVHAVPIRKNTKKKHPQAHRHAVCNGVFPHRCFPNFHSCADLWCGA